MKTINSIYFKSVKMKHTILILARVGSELRTYLKSKGYASHGMNVFSCYDEKEQDTIEKASEFSDFVICSNDSKIYSVKQRQRENV